ncbi:hypothetical protein O3P69_007883 [Scylla paramamosain]|uniref:Uncharacterized protein n=1 Tax=Scylla paramamosain TaxID=85552 RepID=A0AAW0SGH0_SCYPA
MDERRVEMMIVNNEEIPVALPNSINYTSSAHDREASKGLTKSVNRLSVYIGLSAARDVLRLSNGYFFSVLTKSGIKTNGRSEGDALEERSSDGATDGIKLTTMRLTEVTMCRILNNISKEITEILKEKLSEDILFTLNRTDDDVQDFTPKPTHVPPLSRPVR